MGLLSKQKEEIRGLLITKITDKLKKYARETTSMPFLTRLMQDSEKVATYSFIHSLATTLGMSIYEDVSRIIAKDSSEEVFKKMDLGGVLSVEQKSAIENIIGELRNGERKANKENEIKEVLAASTEGGKPQKDGAIADFYIKRKGVEYYFEIKTVKPNIDVFTASKTKLLEWIARKRNPVKTILAFPYNPYYPEPYSRFTQQGLLEKDEELLVGEEYWDFLGGKGTFKDLLEEFDYIGKKFKIQILKKVKQVAKEKMSY